MAEIANQFARGNHILAALHEHGALSSRGLRRILSPPITKSSVRQALSLLKYKGLIVPRFDSLPQNCGNYYQLSLREETRPIISKMIGVNPIHLEERVVRDQELYHSEECAIWCTRFMMMFPYAIVVREFHYMKNEKLKDILLIGRDNHHLRPDILMQLSKNEENHATTIAIEIERSRKADVRLVEKLRKLVTQTILDGVIYICSTYSLIETIRRLYEKKVRERAIRISHYGNNFFLFSNGVPSANHDGPLMLNSDLKPVSLIDWVHFLASTDHTQRRVANLKLLSNA